MGAPIRVPDDFRHWREIDGESRPLVDLRSDANYRAVPVERAVNDGQAEPGAFGFGAEQRLKNLRRRLFRHAGAVVGYDDAKPAAVDRFRGDFDPAWARVT